MSSHEVEMFLLPCRVIVMVNNIKAKGTQK